MPLQSALDKRVTGHVHRAVCLTPAYTLQESPVGKPFLDEFEYEGEMRTIVVSKCDRTMHKEGVSNTLYAMCVGATTVAISNFN